MPEILQKNKNYINEGLMVAIGGEVYPLLKTTEKMVFYMKEDKIARSKLEKIQGVE